VINPIRIFLIDMIKTIKIYVLPLLFCSLVLACTPRSNESVLKADVSPKIPFNPEQYVCFRAEKSIVVDGVLDDASWQQAPWSNLFVDIEGDLKPKPTKETKIKMLWDSSYFYIAAELKDDHIWGKITAHDAVIFNDNDFEVFIDPDGDSHHYMEFEMNALNTTWDLVISKPYRDKGLVINSWEIPGMKSAVKVYGTINNPTDTDEKWTIELAFPWIVMNECAGKFKMPKDSTQWRINFSRVQWITEVVNGEYIKKKDENGRRLPEHNWVWSPQGVIAMHRPETWGYVQFSTKTSDVSFVENADEDVKWALRQLYHRQYAYNEEYKCYTADVKALKLDEVLLNGEKFQPEIGVNKVGYFASYPSLVQNGAEWIIQNDGKIWLKKN
jgi:hypothetical protein